MSDFASRFKAGADIAQGLMDTYQAAKKRAEIAAIANEKESSSFTPGQGQDLQALANAKDAQGNAYYSLGNDGTGNYTVTPNFQNETGSEPAAYTPSTVAANGVTFLGKNYDAPLSDTQRTGARNMAMAGVMENNGDAEGAMRYRQQAKQGVLADKQMEQADLQIAQSKRMGAREVKADAYESSRQEIFNNSVFGQQNASYAKQMQDFVAEKGKYEQGIASGQSPQTLGLPPTQPVRPAYSLADSLADQGALLSNDAKHGKVDAKSFGDFAENMRKIEDEGYLKALNLAQGGGSLDDVAKAFNGTGKLKFDPKSVLSDKMAPGQGGVPERVIVFKDENGNTQTINVMAQLKSLGKANEALSQFYAGETNRRGNAGEVRAEKSLGIQQAQLWLSQSTHNETRTDKVALRSAGVAYEKARQSGDEAGMKAATLDLIQAGGTAPGAASAGDVAEVKLARAMVSAGIYPDMKSALEKTVNKAGTAPDEIFNNAVTAGLKDKSPEKAVGNAKRVMAEMGYTSVDGAWRKGAGGVSAPAGGNAGRSIVASFASEADAESAANSGKLKAGDVVSVGKQKFVWNPPAGGAGSSTPAKTSAPTPPAVTPAKAPATTAKSDSPAKNFYGTEAIAERQAVKAAQVAEENRVDAVKAAQEKAAQVKAKMEREKMIKMRDAGAPNKSLLNTNLLGRP